jgi:DNA-binding Lrp family transcriptional regulator
MNLEQFCLNDEERLTLDYHLSGLNYTEVGQRIGVHRSTVQRRVERIKRRQAMRGYAPESDMTKMTAEPYIVKGTSSLYDSDGTLKLQWVKTSLSLEMQVEMLREAVESLKDDIPTMAPTLPEKTSLRGNQELLNLHVLTDYHMGMLAWAEETGEEDWNLAKAEETLLSWFQYAIDKAPAAKVGMLANLGDHLHFDGLEAITPTHGNILESGSRFPEVVRAVIRSMRVIISMMLVKYDEVHLIMAEGNHDIASEVWLREMFSVFYSEDPRVTVDVDPSTYNCYEHGNVSLFFHHGHKKKIKDLDSTFAAKYRSLFGRTSYSYCHVGHFHSIEVKESNLMVVEQHRTMAPGDAYSAGKGYVSGRSANVITYHKTYGEVGRITITPEMLLTTT